MILHRQGMSLLVVPLIEAREKLLEACHDMARHRDRTVTEQLVGKQPGDQK